MATGINTASPAAARTVTPSRRRRSLFRLGEDIPRGVYLAIAAASFLIPLALWCFYAYTGRGNPLIMPTPTAVLTSLWGMVHDGSLWPDARISVYRIGMGFLLSAALAIPLGILMGAYKSVEAAHEPFVGFVRYVPCARPHPVDHEYGGDRRGREDHTDLPGHLLPDGAGGRGRDPAGAARSTERRQDAGRELGAFLFHVLSR